MANTELVRLVVDAVNNAKAVLHDVERDIASLTKVVQAFSAAAGVVQVGRFAAEMVELGAASHRTEAGFAAMSGSAAQAEANLEAMRAATNGTVNDMLLMQVAAGLLGTGVASTAEELANITRSAVVLGGTFRGLGAQQAADEFSLLLMNADTAAERLDTFGISAAAVKTRAQELQAATAGLSTLQARQIAIMEIATDRTSELSGMLNDQQASIDQLQTEIQGLKVAASEWLADGLMPWINGTRALGAAIEEAGVDRALGLAAMSQADFNAQLEGLPMRVQAGMNAQREYGQELLMAREGIFDANDALQQHAEALAAAGAAASQAALDLQTVEFSAMDLWKIQEAGAQATGQYITQIGSLSAGMLDAGGAAGLLMETFNQLGTTQQEQLALQTGLNMASGEWTQAMIDQAAATQAIAEARMAGLITDQEALALTQEALNQNLGYQESQAALTAAINDSANAYVAVTGAGAAVKPVLDSVLNTAISQANTLGASVNTVSGNFVNARLQAEAFLRSIKSMQGITVTARISVTGLEERQHGGPVSAGGLYLVGERGPELLQMGGSGRVFSNAQTQGMLGGGGGSGGGSDRPIEIVMMMDGREVGRQVAGGVRDVLDQDGVIVQAVAG